MEGAQGGSDRTQPRQRLHRAGTGAGHSTDRHRPAAPAVSAAFLFTGLPERPASQIENHD